MITQKRDRHHHHHHVKRKKGHRRSSSKSFSQFCVPLTLLPWFVIEKDRKLNRTHIEISQKIRFFCFLFVSDSAICGAWFGRFVWTKHEINTILFGINNRMERYIVWFCKKWFIQVFGWDLELKWFGLHILFTQHLNPFHLFHAIALQIVVIVKMIVNDDR